MDVNLAHSVVGWIILNKIKNERGEEIEFKDHLFLLEPFMNWHWKQVCMKSAQVGWSTLAILKTIFGASTRGYNCIYTLPSFDDVHDFVPAKVDGMVTNNVAIAELVTKSDAIQKKQIGDNFIWYRGTHGKKAAIMHTSDLNVYDEYDASNHEVIDLYASRLQKSKYKGEWYFSNPIRPGGIDQLYEHSDKRQWIITCSKCQHKQCLDYFKNVDELGKRFICAACKETLSEDDRRVGEWVAQNPGREVHGYHINQLMCAWVSAKELIYLKETKTPQYFYNMVLGLPYVEKDDVVDRAIISENVNAKYNNMLRNAMGVDVGYRELHYVIGNNQGIFRVGKCMGETMWEDLEGIIKKYNPITVIDANPDAYPRRKLVPKYKNKVFVCFYKRDPERKQLVRWGEQDKFGCVYADRNQMISALIYDFIEEKQHFNTFGRSPQVYIADVLDEYLKHWENLYRVTEDDRNGIPTSEWRHMGPDHFVHATVYFKIALSRVPVSDGVDVSRYGAAITILDDTIPADKIPIAEATEGAKDWLSY